MYLDRKKVWVRWITHSLKHRHHARCFKKMLKGMNKVDRTILLSEWLELDYWFKKYWFGKRIEKIVIRELEKLSK
jgi:hypothetical protein